MFLRSGAIDAGKELGETMALLLVVDVRRRGLGRQRLAGTTCPTKEPWQLRETGGRDHNPDDGSGDGGM